MYSDFEKEQVPKLAFLCFKMNGNQLYWMIIFKLIILSQIGAKRYQNIILEILLLSPLWSTVEWQDYTILAQT
jgi:hypothetical protein